MEKRNCRPSDRSKASRVSNLTEKIKELVRLAQEQGYLTYSDINDALPDNRRHRRGPGRDLHASCATSKSRLSIRPKWIASKAAGAGRGTEDKSRLDILDDPVRMYLKQMGQVPLLTREQEVEISKRIEDAENEVKRIIYSFGFAGKEHIALAEKLISEPPKERFDRVIVDKKIEGRENHLKDLRKLVKNVRDLDQQVDEKYAEWQNAPNKAKREKLRARIHEARQQTAGHLPQILLQTEGHRGNGARRGKHPRQDPVEPARHRGIGEAAQIRAAAGHHSSPNSARSKRWRNSCACRYRGLSEGLRSS